MARKLSVGLSKRLSDRVDEHLRKTGLTISELVRVALDKLIREAGDGQKN